MQSGRARTASYAHGRSASVACGLGQLEVALRPRSPSSQSGASRIEWKLDFSCREWMHCLVECKQLGSAGSMWCNMFSGRQQTRARERVLNWTLRSNTPRYTRRGVHVFYSGLGFDSALWTTKPKTVGPWVVSHAGQRSGVSGETERRRARHLAAEARARPRKNNQWQKI